MCTIIHNVILGGRPDRPQDRTEWLSDDVWNLISRCWSSSWDGRPDVNYVMGALNGAADAVEEVKGQQPIPQNSLAKQPSQTSVFPETSTVQVESWEADLIAFLRACKTGPGAKLEWKKAQEFADMLDAVRHLGKQVCLVLTLRLGSR